LTRITPTIIWLIASGLGLGALAHAQSPATQDSLFQGRFANPSLLPDQNDGAKPLRTIDGQMQLPIGDPAVDRARNPRAAASGFPAQSPMNGTTSLEPLPSGPGQATPTQRPLPSGPGQAPPTQRPRQGGTRSATPNTQPPARTPPAQPAQRVPTPPVPGEAEQQIQFDPSGLVTMHVNELDVRQLLELLSRRSGLNILVSPKVSGTITANFEGTTVDAVLKAVIKLANLVEKTEGPIHYLYTKGELDDDAEITKREKILTRVYKLNYVRSDELLTMIRPFLSEEVGRKRVSVTPSYRFGIGESATFVSGGAGAGGAGGGGASTSNTGGPTNQGAAGGGSTQGGYQPPTGANSNSDSDLLIIQDYESNLKIVDQIIERIDRRPFQVLIEAVIISVDLERTRQLGVNFGLVDNLGTALGTIGSGASLNNNVGFNPTQLLTTAGQIAGSATDPTGFTSGTTGGAKFGFVSNNVTGFIQALETIGSTKILASPRILVLNKQRAEIQLGTRLGFQTFSQNFTSTIQQVQFLNTGTLLRIRPFISEDGMVRMELHPERSSGTVTNNIPNQQTAELTTNVMVPDGATLVIGGLMEDEDDYSIQGLPGLARLPLLGYLFGFRAKSEGRRELVVLLTPHIWSADQVMTHGPGTIMGGHTLDGTKWAGPASADGTSPTQASAGLAAAGSQSAESVRPGAEPEVALAAGDATTGQTGAPLAASPRTAPAGTPAPPAEANTNGRSQDPPPPKRGFFRSFFERTARRFDPEKPAHPQPIAATPDPYQVCDPITRPPDPAAAAPDSPVIPASITKAETPPIQRDEMVSRASATASPAMSFSSGSARSGPRSAAVAGAVNGGDSTNVQSPPVQAAGGWVPAYSPRPASQGGWLPATQTRRPGGARTSPSNQATSRASNRSSDVSSSDLDGRSRRIPPSTSFDRDGRTTGVDPDLTASDSSGSTSHIATAPGRRTRPFHVVRPHETLRSIARDYLGDSRRADEIAELNQDRIAATGTLVPGQTLVLPADAASTRRSN
jgi:general secretion pathway protein D